MDAAALLIEREAIAARMNAAMRELSKAERVHEIVERRYMLLEEEWYYGPGGRVVDPLAELGDSLDALIGCLIEISWADDRLELLNRLLGEGPTAEMLAKIRRGETGDQITRLAARGKLTPAEVRTVREIERVYAHVTAKLRPRVMDLGAAGAVDTETRVPPDSGWLDVLHARVYVPWSREHRAGAEAILALLGGESVSGVQRAQGVQWRTALQRARCAIRAYEAIKTSRLPAARGWSAAGG